MRKIIVAAVLFAILLISMQNVWALKKGLSCRVYLRGQSEVKGYPTEIVDIPLTVEVWPVKSIWDTEGGVGFSIIVNGHKTDYPQRDAPRGEFVGETEYMEYNLRYRIPSDLEARDYQARVLVKDGSNVLCEGTFLLAVVLPPGGMITRTEVATETQTVEKTTTITQMIEKTVTETQTTTVTTTKTLEKTLTNTQTVTKTETVTTEAYGGLMGGSVLGLIIGAALASAIFILRSRSKHGVVQELS